MTLQLQKREDSEMIPMVFAPELECKKCGYHDVEIVCADGKTFIGDILPSGDDPCGPRNEPSEWRVTARLRVLVRCNNCHEMTGYGLGVKTTVEDGEDLINGKPMYWHRGLLEPAIDEYYED